MSALVENSMRSMDMQIGGMTLSMATTSMPDSSPGLRHLDPDTDFKVRRITSCVNEAIHMAANEPSLGLYRIQEHVHRTAPHLAVKKKDLKANNKRISETSYDLNLSMDVVHSMQTISNFTRIQEALKTAIEMKRALNAKEEDERATRELDLKNAKIANRSISCNEPAEGYICPVCYFALSSQEELISHWQREHNIKECENDVFQEVEMPLDDSVVMVTGITLEDDNDMTVIHSLTSQDENDVSKCRAISEAEDVVKGFFDSECNYLERRETSASEASSILEYRDVTECESIQLLQDHVKCAEVIVHNANQTDNLGEFLQESSDSSYESECRTSNGVDIGESLHETKEFSPDSSTSTHIIGDSLHVPPDSPHQVVATDNIGDSLHVTPDSPHQVVATDNIGDSLHVTPDSPHQVVATDNIQ